MRRTIHALRTKAQTSNINLEHVEPGWHATTTGLASSQQDLQQLLEEMRVIPPRIYSGPPPPVIPPPIVKPRTRRIRK